MPLEMLPLKSHRCTSRCPAAGWLTCSQVRHHTDACTAGGYRWRRGRGHVRPVLLHDPIAEPIADPARRLEFGIDRMPAAERTCAAWPTLAMVAGRRTAAFARWLTR